MMLRRDRIEKLVEDANTSVFEVSLKAGHGRTYLSEVLKGKSKDPQISKISKIAAALGSTTSYLIGETDSPDGEPFQPPVEEYRMIGEFDIRASAGNGAVTIDGAEAKPLNHHAFRAQWLNRLTNAPDDQLALIFADGDSMEPTLRDGDSMLVDRTQTNLRRPGIYVIGFQDMLNVKRVSLNEVAGTIHISSDNPAYSSYDAGPDDILEVAGRVIWVGRKV